MGLARKATLTIVKQLGERQGVSKLRAFNLFLAEDATLHAMLCTFGKKRKNGSVIKRGGGTPL